MTDIVAFVRARLDEVEADARAAWPGPWAPSDDEYEVLDVGAEAGFVGTLVAEVRTLSGHQQRMTSRHIARHHPARVLADVEAKRRILAPHKPQPLSKYDRQVWRFKFECASESWTCYGDGADHVEWPCETVKLLALPDAGHPDYREEWRP